MALTPDHPNELRKVTVEVKPPSPRKGVVSWWDADTILRVELDDNPEPIAVISGNTAGLASLARHLLTLAQDDTPCGSHMDFDTYCGWLEAGSAAIRVELD